MPLPRFRFSVRRMMVAVAVVAIVIGADNMRRRRDRWRNSGSGTRWGEFQSAPGQGPFGDGGPG